MKFILVSRFQSYDHNVYSHVLGLCSQCLSDYRGVRINPIMAVFRLWSPRFSTYQHKIPHKVKKLARTVTLQATLGVGGLQSRKEKSDFREVQIAASVSISALHRPKFDNWNTAVFVLFYRFLVSEIGLLHRSRILLPVLVIRSVQQRDIRTESRHANRTIQKIPSLSLSPCLHNKTISGVVPYVGSKRKRKR